MLSLEVALLSDRGGRKYNEDACGHWHSERYLCCVLADGAGGHGGGEVASRLAVQELIGRFSQAPAQDGYHPTKPLGGQTHYGDQTLVLLESLLTLGFKRGRVKA